MNLRVCLLIGGGHYVAWEAVAVEGGYALLLLFGDEKKGNREL